MLGDLITRSLVMILGYAYPAFECYKTVEKNRVEIEELRFWCQYWILVAMLAVLERVGDVFISWLPMYGELKLAFVIYLWYPKTKGTAYVYETLRPYVTRNEPYIDRKIQEYRARAWDFAIYYWKNCTELGSTTFLQVLQYLAGQSSKFTASSNEKGNDPPSGSSKAKKWAPSAPPAPSSSVNHSISEPPKSDTIKVHPHRHTESTYNEDTFIPDYGNVPPGSPNTQARSTRFRRSKPPHN